MVTLSAPDSRTRRRSTSTITGEMSAQDPPVHETTPPTDAAPAHLPEVADPAPAQTESESAEDEAAPGWLLPGLAGAGALLAGSLWLVLRQHRRTQLRYRRPGRIIAPPPEELRAVEKSVQVTGSATAHPIEGTRCGTPGPQPCTAPGLRPTLTEPDRADARGAGRTPQAMDRGRRCMAALGRRGHDSSPRCAVAVPDAGQRRTGRRRSARPAQPRGTPCGGAHR